MLPNAYVNNKHHINHCEVAYIHPARIAKGINQPRERVYSKSFLKFTT